jgi:hypothetical protein
MMAFEAIMGGAPYFAKLRMASFGDHALPEAQGRIDALYFEQNAKCRADVKQRE